jgi:hypothetical protein
LISLKNCGEREFGMKTLFSLKMTSALVAVGLSVVGAQAAFIPLGATNYFQDFNSLANSGKSKVLPAGWDFVNFGGAPGFYTADDGSSTHGALYSYGNAASSDRALGSLRSGGSGNQQSGDFVNFGAAFENTGNGTISRLNISYTGEEWRLGAMGRGQDRLQFQYSLNASGVGDAKARWLNFPSLDFLTPNLNEVGAHNGDLAANQTQLAGSIGFLNIPVGGTFWVRWVDDVLPGGGPEDGLAVDNFSISAVPEATTLAAGFGMTCLLMIVLLKSGRRRTTQPSAPGIG